MARVSAIRRKQRLQNGRTLKAVGIPCIFGDANAEESLRSGRPSINRQRQNVAEGRQLSARASTRIKSEWWFRVIAADGCGVCGVDAGERCRLLCHLSVANCWENHGRCGSERLDQQQFMWGGYFPGARFRGMACVFLESSCHCEPFSAIAVPHCPENNQHPEQC